MTVNTTTKSMVLPWVCSPLGPVLGNILMCVFEEIIWFNAKISPSFWNLYVDDTFTMFHNNDSANEFLHYLNSCHSNIKFTIEFEQNNAIPFLDICIGVSLQPKYLESFNRFSSFQLLATTLQPIKHSSSRFTTTKDITLLS